MKKLHKYWIEFQIIRIEKSISRRELSLYFDGYDGQMCIEADIFDRSRIEYLKSLF